MKTRMAYLLFIGVLLCGCDQDAKVVVPEPNCGIKIRIIHHSCAYIFAQIIDPQYNGLADFQWRSAEGRLYKNVFIVNNPCVFNDYPSINDRWEEVFEVSIAEAEPNGCVTCAMGYSGDLPGAKFKISFCKDDDTPGEL